MRPIIELEAEDLALVEERVRQALPATDKRNYHDTSQERTTDCIAAHLRLGFLVEEAFRKHMRETLGQTWPRHKDGEPDEGDIWIYQAKGDCKGTKNLDWMLVSKTLHDSKPGQDTDFYVFGTVDHNQEAAYVPNGTWVNDPLLVALEGWYHAPPYDWEWFDKGEDIGHGFDAFVDGWGTHKDMLSLDWWALIEYSRVITREKRRVLEAIP